MGKVSRKHDRQRQARQASKTSTVVTRRTHSNATGANSHIRTTSAQKDRLKSPPDGRKAKGSSRAFQGKGSGKVPFGEDDRVLLVGEGDFSFALSLAKHHNVRSIVATSHDTEAALLAKYPHAKVVIESLIGVTNSSCGGQVDNDEFRGFSPSPSSDIPEAASSPPSSATSDSPVSRISIYHGVDATKLSTSHKKLMHRHGPFTKIVFNFPHVGGLSTDVNRQTRANQLVIQGFFGAAKHFLASPDDPVEAPPSGRRNRAYYDSDDAESVDESPSSDHGQILVTLFAGEAYTDWNIRDLARDQGLKVVESFKFPWQAYPGYRHARTIGEVKTGRDRSEEGKRRGAWRGEEREARCFVFENKDENGWAGMKKRKRKGDADDDSGSD